MKSNDLNIQKPQWIHIALKWSLVLLAIVLTIWILYQNTSTLVLLSISFLLSYLLDPIVSKLEKKGLSRWISITLLFTFAIVALTVFALILIPQITQETADLFSKYQGGSSSIEQSVQLEITNDSLDGESKNHFVKWFDDNINPILKDLGLQELDREELRIQINEFLKWIDVHYPHWMQSMWSVFQSMFTGVANFIVGILNFLLIPVFTFYLLRDYPSIKESFYTSVPPGWRRPIEDWACEFDRVVGGFIRGQFSIALVLAIINAIGLTVLGVPFGFLIGIIAGLANMVPYMSIVVGLLPAVVLSFLDQPDLWRAIWVIVIFSASQALEGFYLSPKIMGQEVGLHPVIIMLAIIFGGSLFGLTGIVLAVPLAAILKVVAVRTHHAWKANWNHNV